MLPLSWARAQTKGKASRWGTGKRNPAAVRPDDICACGVDDILVSLGRHPSRNAARFHHFTERELIVSQRTLDARVGHHRERYPAAARLDDIRLKPDDIAAGAATIFSRCATERYPGQSPGRYLRLAAQTISSLRSDFCWTMRYFPVIVPL